MKVRLIGGIREVDHKDPLYGLWLAQVAFPMRVTNYDATEATEPEELTLCNEQQLHTWAQAAFDEEGYDIFDLEVPSADAHPEGDSHQSILALISSKKAEYERAAASSQQGRGEIEAVIAALESLLTHALAITAENSAPGS